MGVQKGRGRGTKIGASCKRVRYLNLQEKTGEEGHSTTNEVATYA